MQTSSTRSLAFAAAGFLFLTSCIIVKETQVPVEEENSRLSRRVERLERQAASNEHALPAGHAAVPRLGEISAISSPGNLLMLRLEMDHGLVAGQRIAIVGSRGFKSLAQIEEIFDGANASARRVGEITFGTETQVGDAVVPIASHPHN